MSEQAAQQVGAVDAAATVPPAVEAAGIEAPSIAPDHEAPPKPDLVKADAPKVEPPRIEVPRISARQAETKPEPNPELKPGKLIVMAPSERSWTREEFAPHVKADEVRTTGSKRRLSAMVAVAAIAACVGAISGALATAGMMHFASPAPVQVADTSALDASVARIDGDIVALKASVEHNSKTSLSQSNRANDRLDKLEKAQAEPMARLAKLSETVDKLRATPPAAPVQAAATAPAKETTGSIAPAPAQVATAAAPAPVPAAPKTEVGRLPTVEGWRLRDVANGGALIEGRDGLYEVYAGDPIPGLGRVDAIRRQDGRWVVVTAKGLITAR
jgi:hypothetical protein